MDRRSVARVRGLGVGPPHHPKCRSVHASSPELLWMNRPVLLEFDVWRAETAVLKTPTRIFKLAGLSRTALVQKFNFTQHIHNLYQIHNDQH